MKSIKTSVNFGDGKKVPVNPQGLPLEMTVKDLADICCKKHIYVTITLQAKAEEKNEV